MCSSEVDCFETSQPGQYTVLRGHVSLFGEVACLEVAITWNTDLFSFVDSRLNLEIVTDNKFLILLIFFTNVREESVV